MPNVVLPDPSVAHPLVGHWGRGRGGVKPVLMVLHRQQGNNDLWQEFENRPVDNQADSTMWSPKAGGMTRFLRDEDTAWTNGDWAIHPNLANPVIARLYAQHAYTNAFSLTVETQGFINEALTDAQVEAIAKQLAYWSVTWAIPLDRNHVVGHYEVGEHPYCPGPLFPFDRIIQRGQAILRALGVDPLNPQNSNNASAGGNGQPAANNLDPLGDPSSWRSIQAGIPETWVTNDEGFLDYWRNHGRLEEFGFPIEGARPSRRDANTIVQYFQRARFEYNLGNKQFSLGLVGAELLAALGDKAP